MTGVGTHRPKGRPLPEGQRKITASITIPQADLDELESIGSGNRSAGVRHLLNWWRNRRKKTAPAE